MSDRLQANEVGELFERAKSLLMTRGVTHRMNPNMRVEMVLKLCDVTLGHVELRKHCPLTGVTPGITIYISGMSVAWFDWDGGIVELKQGTLSKGALVMFRELMLLEDLADV